MAKLGFGIASVLALLSGACSDDGAESKSTTGGSGGTGGGSGSGGQAGAGGGAGAPSCDGTQSTDQKLSQAMKVLRDALAKDNVPGGAFAVVKDGKLVDLGVAGSKRAGTCDPITPDTLFLTGFVTQLLTSIAALDAVEDGKLALDAPITDFVPALRLSHGDPSEITLHHLLSASSMVHTSPSEPCVPTLADAFDEAFDPKLYATPGTMFDWNEVNIMLAGLALENVDGKPFADAIRDRVLTPLSMGGAYDTATIVKSDHALGHSPEEREVDTDCRAYEASELYRGSIRDVARLAEYLTGGAGDILDPSTFDSLLSRQGPAFFSVLYAVHGGAIVGLSYAPGDDVVWTGYTGFGFSPTISIYKQRRLAVITLLNVDGADHNVNNAIAAIYDPTVDRSPAPFTGSPYTPDPASFPALVGTYRDDLGFKGTGPRTIEVFLDPGDSSKLAGNLTGSDGTSEPISFEVFCCADNFNLMVGPQTLPVRFWRDATGNVSALQIDVEGDSGPPFFRLP